MIFEPHPYNPFQVQISFHKLIENLEEIALSHVDYRARYAQSLLEQVASVPEFKTGITDVSVIEKHNELLRYLLADLFPTALTRNEIKAVTIPFHNIIFNYSERFRNILDNAGPEFDMVIRDFDDDHFYVMSCILILVRYYNVVLDFNRPFFYDIPDREGILRHYRILYNGDFIEIFKTDAAPDLSPADIETLLDNFHDVALWKAKFPPGSYILRGFGIMTLYDATTENAVSNLKSTLLSKKGEHGTSDLGLEDIFRSIFNIADLRVGYTAVNVEADKFIALPSGKQTQSFILGDATECACDDVACAETFEALMRERRYVSVADVSRFGQENDAQQFVQQLLDQNVRSAIFAPVIKDERLLGIVEVVAPRPYALNSINAQKMDIVMPYITDTIDRYYSEVQNQIDAMIQNEYTTIHPSVYWKFRDEAYAHLNDTRETAFHEIVFAQVYPLYGQIDIKGSSESRNASTQGDLYAQLGLLVEIFERMPEAKKLPIIEQKLFELQRWAQDLAIDFRTDSEQQLMGYLQADIHPILRDYKSDPALEPRIKAYFDKLDPVMGTIYEQRRKFDTSLSIINRKMAEVLDKEQIAAQSHYPHYYERFKTDGVEHNLYIGHTITNQPDFDVLYLYNLRLWQLQVMCEMESKYHALQPTLPYPLRVTSLLLVFSSPITIRFRMDEKRFDVDGSYNARYEVVKKRIDKAFIKGTRERITQEGRITIVYTRPAEEQEYRRYVAFLQHKGKLGNDIEIFDVEDLQGVSGLKAMRVPVLFDAKDDKLYRYEELLKEIEN